MLGLWNEQGNQYEGLGKKYEGRSGAFDIMSMRFTTVRKGLINAESSPTILRAFENVRRAKEAAEALQFKQEVNRIAETTTLDPSLSTTEAVPIVDQSRMAPVVDLHDRQQAIAAARANEAAIRNVEVSSPENRQAA